MRRSRSALTITETELNVMAALRTKPAGTLARWQGSVLGITLAYGS